MGAGFRQITLVPALFLANATSSGRFPPPWRYIVLKSALFPFMVDRFHQITLVPALFLASRPDLTASPPTQNTRIA
jgi:hypothetical protein